MFVKIQLGFIFWKKFTSRLLAHPLPPYSSPQSVSTYGEKKCSAGPGYTSFDFILIGLKKSKFCVLTPQNPLPQIGA